MSFKNLILLASSFHINFFALMAAVLFFGGCLYGIKIKDKQKPQALFSDLSPFLQGRRSLKEKMVNVPFFAKILALALLVFCFADPHLQIPYSPLDNERSSEEEQEDQPTFVPTEGIAAYLVLDHSGSMQQPVIGQSSDGRKVRTTRLAVLKKLTEQFIKGSSSLGLRGRPTDLLGLVQFARVPEIITPLTLDHTAVIEHLEKLEVVQNAKRDGTAIAYAIFKTANLMAATQQFAKDLPDTDCPAYEIISQIMIVVTDGLPTTHPEDRGHPTRTVSLLQAAQLAKDHNIRLYIVNVEPALADYRFASQRRELERAAERTGGRFFLVDRGQSLLDIYRSIDQLEKSVLPGEIAVSGPIEQIHQFDPDNPPYQRASFVPIFVLIAQLLLIGATILESTWLKRAP